VPHLRRAAPSKHTPCHVTLPIRRGVPSLRTKRLVHAVELSFREARERGEFRVVHYSIQRDHVHLLVEAEGSAALARGMKSVGARIARAVHRVFGRRGAVLADRYHHRVLRTPREVRNALAYLLLNARKHGEPLAERARSTEAAIDPASSGRWFDGWTRVPTTPREPAPVAQARSWLLRFGWWRHGRIDPSEVPGRAR
jgi:REP element-mobilizing transposase RayT